MNSRISSQLIFIKGINNTHGERAVQQMVQGRLGIHMYEIIENIYSSLSPVPGTELLQPL